AYQLDGCGVLTMTKYAVFDADGFPMGFYAEDIHGAPDAEGTLIPQGAVKITDQQWHAFLSHPGARKWSNGHVVEYTPPEPEPSPYRLYKSSFIRRLSDDEAVTMEGVMASAPAKLRMLFNSVEYFISN